jgi:hypothetical protein
MTSTASIAFTARKKASSIKMDAARKNAALTILSKKPYKTTGLNENRQI